MSDEKPKRSAAPSRSILWPLILIGVGVLWLMGNLGIISGAGIAAVVQMWPLLLILIGLDLLVGRGLRVVSILIGLTGVVLVVFIALIGPSLGLGQAAQVTTQTLVAPGPADRAEVRIEGGSAPLRVAALDDSVNVLEATISDTGEIDFRAEDGPLARVSLRRRGISYFFLGFGPSRDQRLWSVGLSRSVPVELRLDAGSGENRLDLTDIPVRSLRVGGGSGGVWLTLPATEQPMTTHLEVGSGRWAITIPERPRFDLNFVDTGSGNVTINVPESVGVRLQINSGGSGAVIVPILQQQSGDADEGVWLSENYERADYRVTIMVRDLSSGDLIVQR